MEDVKMGDMTPVAFAEHSLQQLSEYSDKIMALGISDSDIRISAYYVDAVGLASMIIRKPEMAYMKYGEILDQDDMENLKDSGISLLDYELNGTVLQMLERRVSEVYAVGALSTRFAKL